MIQIHTYTLIVIILRPRNITCTEHTIPYVYRNTVKQLYPEQHVVTVVFTGIYTYQCEEWLHSMCTLKTTISQEMCRKKGGKTYRSCNEMRGLLKIIRNEL